MALKIDFRDGDVLVWGLSGEGATPTRVSDYDPTIYVYADEREALATARQHLADHPSVATTAFESHRPGFRHGAEPMLRVDAERLAAVDDVARQIRGWGKPGTYRLFDVDLSPEFRYALETGTSPPARPSPG
jgi:DNA polymerase I